MRTHLESRRQTGFSLIEVLIAVIVLATGLLALAALQGKLTTNSADAKARSRVAALLTSAIDDERASGYDGIATFATTSCSTASTATALQTAICTAQGDAGISNLSLLQSVTRYYGLSGGATFTTTAPPASAVNYGDYKLIKLTATWTDATGAPRSVAATTITSMLNLTASSTLLSKPLTTTSSLTPTVHEANPSLTAGVIPIAVGVGTSGADTASTNPRPSVDSKLPSTTFNTLTYQAGGLDTSITASIRKRMETTVAECVCQGASSNPLGSDVFLGAATYRPTYWNGIKYVAPTNANVTPYSAQYADMVGAQNDLCTICCRDHHDSSTDTVKFDPVTGDYNRYKVTASASKGSVISFSLVKDSSGNPVAANMNSDIYLDACRVIRVDGLWRVAADLQSKHMGLIPTNQLGFATTSSPNAASAAKYEEFVKAYLGNEMNFLMAGGTEPDPNTEFNATTYGLNIDSIAASTVTGDYRYLHARGLYLDYLQPEAVTKLINVNKTCASTDYPNCLLPYLPFSTISVTQLAKWAPLSATTTTTGKLGVTTTSTDNTATECSAPSKSGGTTIRGCITGTSAGVDSAVASMGKSNSAVAASAEISPYELKAVNSFKDSQEFQISGTSTSSEFFANLTGPDVTLGTTKFSFPTFDLSTTNDPVVLWGIGADSDYCFANVSRTDTDPDPYDCVTTVPLTLPVNVTLSNYNQVVQQTVTNPCGGTGTYSQPTLVCYTVASASLATGGYSTNFAVSNGKTSSEQTVIAITKASSTSLTANNTLNVTFNANGSQAGSYTCDAVTNVPTFTTPTACP